MRSLIVSEDFWNSPAVKAVLPKAPTSPALMKKEKLSFSPTVSEPSTDATPWA